MASDHELSRQLVVDRVPSEGLAFSIDASDAERAALARRFGLGQLMHLSAAGNVEWRAGRHILALRCDVRAEIEQTCVVTLEPVASQLRFSFERLFTTEATPDAEEIFVDPEAETPEPLDGRVIDLGEIVAEELALEIDPYPRGAGADEVLEQYATEDEDAPFVALGKLRHRNG